MLRGQGLWRVEHHAWVVTCQGVLLETHRQTPGVGVRPQQGVVQVEKSYLG